MRDLALKTIAAAAVACGLPETSVFSELENADDENVFLPEERLEIAFLEENLTRQGWRVGRAVLADCAAIADGAATADCAATAGGCRTRYALYKAVLPVRVLARGTNQDKLEAFCRNFLRALPARLRDGHGNPVRLAAHRAVRKGYTFASIRIEETPTQALHLHFTGIVHKDEDTGLITHITLHPRYEEYGK